MKQWNRPTGPAPAHLVEREMPKPPEQFWFQCLFGAHKADLLHKGTAYCRSCYDEKNRIGQLIN